MERSRGRQGGSNGSIDVVIPALDEAEQIEATLSGVRAGAGNARLDVVVVDGGSRDGTRDIARACGARVIECAPGRARQLQRGLAATAGEAVVFVHADTRLPQGWADAVGRALARPGCVGGAFDLSFEPGAAAGGAERSLRWVERGARLRSRWLGLPYGDQALFARRDVLREIGGIPQSPLMEDLDLVARLRRRGRLAMLPLAVRTSPRRHLAAGVERTALRHAVALAAWWLGVPRAALQRWLGR